jgi:hypothetical protein
VGNAHEIGKLEIVSLRPVSHSDTRGEVKPSRLCISVKAATLRKMRWKSFVPRTLLNEDASAASRETRNSSSPASASSRPLLGVSAVPLVLNSTYAPRSFR